MTEIDILGVKDIFVTAPPRGFLASIEFQQGNHTTKLMIERREAIYLYEKLKEVFQEDQDG